MSTGKAKGTRSTAQNLDSVGVRKIHSRHTWVEINERLVRWFFFNEIYLEIREYYTWNSSTRIEKSRAECNR